MAETRAAEKRLKVFISYSRRDLSFAQQIVSALEARGVAPKIDMRDLPKLEDWRRELLEEFVAIYSIVTVSVCLRPGLEPTRDCRLIEPRSAKQPLMIPVAAAYRWSPNGSIQLEPSVTQCF
jgi:hypothetical protein